MTHANEDPRERDRRIHVETRAQSLSEIATSLQAARQAMNRAPASIRHAARFHADLALMIDAIEAQRHE